MTAPVLLTELSPATGLPEQGLVLCEACKAVNLPGSNYCCICGLTLPGGSLDAVTRAEVESLVEEACRLADGGPVWAEAGESFQSRVHTVTMSRWPAALANPNFVTDPWSGLGTLENAAVLLIDRLEGSPKAMLPLLETIATGSRPLLVVTGFIDPDILATLTVNHLRNTLRSLVLLLSLPGETHPLLLADLAAVLRGKVVERSRLEKTVAGSLPTLRTVYAGHSAAWACDLPAVPVPPLEGDPVVVAARRGIHAGTGACIEIGANSRADIESRRRYACRLLRGGSASPPERSPNLAARTNGSTVGLGVRAADIPE